MLALFCNDLSAMRECYEFVVLVLLPRLSPRAAKGQCPRFTLTLNLVRVGAPGELDLTYAKFAGVFVD